MHRLITTAVTSFAYVSLLTGVLRARDTEDVVAPPKDEQQLPRAIFFCTPR